MRHRSVRVLVSVVVAATTLVVGGGRGSAQPPPGGFVIRYACFTATPRPGVVLAPKEVVPVFRQLGDGSILTLGPTPQGFLEELARLEPRFEYRLQFAGEAASDAHNRVVYRAGPNPLDRLQISVHHEVHIAPHLGPDDTVSLHQRSSTSFRLPTSELRVSGSSDGTHSRVVVGRTYHQGIDTIPSGEQIVHVFCTLRRSQPPEERQATSPTVGAAIRRGYVLLSAAEETFARLNAPINNQTIKGGERFTVSTDHKVTWQRHDDCGHYPASYRFRRLTTWQAATETDTGPLEWILPMTVGRHSRGFAGSPAVFTADAPYGWFTCDAWVCSPADDDVAHGATTFHVVRTGEAGVLPRTAPGLHGDGP